MIGNVTTATTAAAVSFLSPHKFPRQMSVPGLRASIQTAPSVANTCHRPASLYEVLRVKKSASPVEIKAAYRNLAKVYHPDSARPGSSDGRDFIEIHEAYSTLSDPKARALYDLTLAVGSGRRFVRYDVSGFYRTRRWETDQCW